MKVPVISPLWPCRVRPAPRVSVAPLEMSRSVVSEPPKRILPVPDHACVPCAVSAPTSLPLAPPSRMVPFKVRPLVTVILGAKTLPMSRVPSSVTPLRVLLPWLAAVIVVPVCTVAFRSVPPAMVKLPLLASVPAIWRVPLPRLTGAFAVTLRLLITSVVFWEWVIGLVTAMLITASSAGPGLTPPCQLAAVSQSPPLAFPQTIIAGAMRSSSSSSRGRRRDLRNRLAVMSRDMAMPRRADPARMVGGGRGTRG